MIDCQNISILSYIIVKFSSCTVFFIHYCRSLCDFTRFRETEIPKFLKMEYFWGFGRIDNRFFIKRNDKPTNHVLNHIHLVNVLNEQPLSILPSLISFFTIHMYNIKISKICWTDIQIFRMTSYFPRLQKNVFNPLSVHYHFCYK